MLLTLVGSAIWISTTGRDLDSSFFFAVLQYSATIGPVALGFGLGMLAGQFDLSVSSMFVFAGIVAITFGGSSWVVGLLVALGAAAAVGLIQGLLVVRLGAPSLPVTLGGLVTLAGLSYLITGSKAASFSDYDIGVRLGQSVAGVFSARSIVVILCFAIAAVLLHYTRLGRDVYATGSNEFAAKSVGINVGAITVGVLILSAVLTALSGALVAFTLASASPNNATNVLIPAVVAAVIGGIRVTGGAGTPLGILAGVLTLSIVETAFNVVAAPQYVTEITYGLLLGLAILAAAPDRLKLVRAFKQKTAST
jgi:ribose/xylose/arabinose/galactoside ABC-type transport system permease subunit